MQRTLLSRIRHDLSLLCVSIDLFEMIRVSFFGLAAARPADDSPPWVVAGLLANGICDTNLDPYPV